MLAGKSKSSTPRGWKPPLIDEYFSLPGLGVITPVNISAGLVTQNVWDKRLELLMLIKILHLECCALQQKQELSCVTGL